VAVNLCELISALARLVEGIEGGLMETFKNLPDRAASDMWVALAFEPGPNNSVALPPQDPNHPSGAEQGK
jgi:hypothetical protein